MCLLKNEPTSLYVLQAKTVAVGATGKPSVNSAKHYVVCIRPETKRAYHEQGEVCGNTDGGPNRRVVRLARMTCGKK